MRDANRRYNHVAVLLHWTIAALVVWQMYLGFYRSEPGLFDWHKTIGIAILALSVVRLIWRLVNPPPPYPAELPAWERTVAGISHTLFYVLLIGLPLSGWGAVSTGRAALTSDSTDLIGGIALPLLPLPQSANDLMGQAHVLMVWIAIALVVLHVGAALKHQFVDRSPVANRMWPFGVRR